MNDFFVRNNKVIEELSNMKHVFVGIFLFFGMHGISKAGVDLVGNIGTVWLAGDNFYFSIKEERFGNTSDTTITIGKYCKSNWGNFRLYVPVSDSKFPYYYGLITSANANGNLVKLANISKFNGTTQCDISQTGYGIVVYPNPTQ